MPRRLGTDSLTDKMELGFKVGDFPAPERLASPVRMVGAELEVIHLDTAPGQVVYYPHCPEGFDKAQAVVIKIAEGFVATEKKINLTPAFRGTGR